MAKLQKLLGARVYELREKVNLTQAQLAEKANVSNDTISRIERGVRSPSFEVLERLAKALNTEVRELFNFANRPFLKNKCPLELVELLNYLADRKPQDIKTIYVSRASVKLPPASTDSSDCTDLCAFLFFAPWHLCVKK